MEGLSRPAPLDTRHDLSSFDCGDRSLNEWLQQRARKNESGFSRTYVACDGDRVAAYFCISAGAVDRSASPPKLRRNAPDPLSAAIIGRLAVDRNYAGRGLGAEMLADALDRIASASLSISVRTALVQAKDEAAQRFYLHCAEFLEYPPGSRTLFLPIETIMAAR